jgi:predicted DNA-binding transcriptional regulator AlpA
VHNQISGLNYSSWSLWRHAITGDFPIPEALTSLGEPLEVHEPKPGAGRAGYFTIAGILAILSGLTVIGIINPPQQNPPPPIVFISLMGVCGFLALVFFGVGLYAQSYTLILFRDALARTGASAPEIFRWSDVKEVYTFPHPVAGKHRIVAQDGRKLEIGASVKDGRKLGQTVQQALFDRMLPAAVKTFEGGGAVTFGPLRVDHAFLYYKDKQLAWNEIAKMQLLYNAYTRSIQFEVKAAGSALLPWCVVKTQDIPNLDTFKALVERKRAFTK